MFSHRQITVESKNTEKTPFTNLIKSTEIFKDKNTCMHFIMLSFFDLPPLICYNVKIKLTYILCYTIIIIMLETNRTERFLSYTKRKIAINRCHMFINSYNHKFFSG
jgi:hypothetical protein